MHYPTGEDEFRAYLSGDHPSIRRDRALLRWLPTDPRCKTCNAPFGMPGALVARVIGRPRWSKNPTFCAHCARFLQVTGIMGAEVEITILFADVRGSTELAERIGAAEFGRLMSRYYKAASRALIEADGIVDKFIGDGVLGLFVPAMSGPDHSARAVVSARHILRATGHPGSPWLPVGVGVHRGVAFVGAIGEKGELEDFTALGDAVNAAARLGALAGAGEVLVSAAAAAAAGVDGTRFERRTLDLRGRSEPLDVVVLTAT